MALLTMSLGFSQDNLEDFEGAAPTFEFSDGANTANVVADPDAGGAQGNVLQLITNTSGDPWQGTKLIFQGDRVDLTTDKTMTIRVYSDVPQSFLAKVVDGENAGPDSATDANYTTPGVWQELTFDFSDNIDNTGVANDVYGGIIFYPGWENLGGTCDVGCYSTGGPGSTPAITLYLDDISGTASAPDPCANGVQDGDEEGVDCGGSCPNACPNLPPAAPLPSAPDGETYSIYNDTNGYTTQFPFLYNFGDGLSSEPNLDTGGGTNLAFELDFSVGGWGAGEGGPDDVSAYNWVSFDYYTDSGILPGFQISLNDSDGMTTGEYFYQVGDTGSGDQIDLVVGSWQRVVIPMSYFTGIGFDNTALFQWNIVPYNFSVVDGDLVYIDNFILTQNDPTLSTGSVEVAELKVYPNPTLSEWNIRSNNQTITSVQVFDVLGKQVMTLNTQGTEVSIDATELNSGLYFARINTPNGSQSFKLVKE